MTNQAVVHREIGIDCGHRVPDHKSKCRSPHGHRYRIIVSCTGDVLEEVGESEHGMVIDFGYIKKFMMDILDAVFDHAFVVAKHDQALMRVYFPDEDALSVIERYTSELDRQLDAYGAALKSDMDATPIRLPRTLKSEQDPDGMKIVPVAYTPTAENMARHMFELMERIMKNYYRADRFRITNVRLYETPNAFVDYPARPLMGQFS